MYRHSRARGASERFAARRQREDEAPRLAEEVPALTSLRLVIEERSSLGAVSAPKHMRHIVVESAPALFFITCGDPRCTEGGHDLTYEIMSALRRQVPAFEGTHECGGMTGTSACTRVLKFEGMAEYRTS